MSPKSNRNFSMKRNEMLFLTNFQSHKRLKRTLFIRTKQKMRIFRVISFMMLQNDTKQLNGEKLDIELGYFSAFGLAILFSCPVL